MKIYLKQVMLLLFMVSLFSCSKDEDNLKSSDKKLISFSFLATNNPIINNNVTASIDATTKNVTVNLPSDIPVNKLIPEISISSKASINPQGEQNFTNPVPYTITAEDGSTSIYTVTVNSKSSAKQIKSFLLLSSNNPIQVNIVANIDEENKMITALMPLGTDLTQLLPDIQLSEFATPNHTTVQDFTEPVEYIITAEDGSDEVYTVVLSTLFKPQQVLVLQAILDANPDHDLSNWDFTGKYVLTSIEGVTLNLNGDITKLNLFPDIVNIPPEIALLSNLRELILSGNNITTIPPEIGQLKNLKSLNLSNNNINIIPPEIGELEDNLEFLSLGSNNITVIPPEIGQLKNLIDLSIGNNLITTIPPEIGQLNNLEFLSMDDNQLNALPPEIGLLGNLKQLHLTRNALTALPPEIGFLNNLEVAFILNNNITNLPNAIDLLMEYNPNLSFNYDSNITTAVTSQKDALISMHNANPDNTLDWSVNNFPGVKFHANGNPKTITMNNKNLRRIPDALGELTQLESFNINNNNIENLPNSIGNISTLGIVTAASNQLSTVPKELGGINTLALLSITNNPLTNIPQEVCNLQITNGGILSILTDPGEGCN